MLIEPLPRFCAFAQFVHVDLQLLSHAAVPGGSQSSPQFTVPSPHEDTGEHDELHFCNEVEVVQSPAFFSSHDVSAPHADSHKFEDGALPLQSTFMEAVSASNFVFFVPEHCTHSYVPEASSFEYLPVYCEAVFQQGPPVVPLDCPVITPIPPTQGIFILTNPKTPLL